MGSGSWEWPVSACGCITSVTLTAGARARLGPQCVEVGWEEEEEQEPPGAWESEALEQPRPAAPGLSEVICSLALPGADVSWEPPKSF